METHGSIFLGSSNERASQAKFSRSGPALFAHSQGRLTGEVSPRHLEDRPSPIWQRDFPQDLIPKGCRFQTAQKSIKTSESDFPAEKSKQRFRPVRSGRRQASPRNKIFADVLSEFLREASLACSETGEIGVFRGAISPTLRLFFLPAIFSSFFLFLTPFRENKFGNMAQCLIIIRCSMEATV